VVMIKRIRRVSVLEFQGAGRGWVGSMCGNGVEGEDAGSACGGGVVGRGGNK
jgi:hypothetical protein